MSVMSVSSDLIRGHIDTIILRVLYEADNYGYEIIKSIKRNSNGLYELKEPSLYTSLKRLEKGKMVSSYWGDKTQGGRRKYYQITSQGEAAYLKAIEQWHLAKKVIDLLVEGNGDNG